MRTIHFTVERVRAHYLEMPEQRLRAGQLQRLCGIEPAICHVVLDALVNEHFLCLNPDGHYCVTQESVSRQQSMKPS
jgi:DNA-binding IclR family transcriptional regulator